MQGQAAVASAKVEAARIANLDRAAAEKAEHQAEVMVLDREIGREVAAQLTPALVQAITEAVAQMKENQNVND